MSHYFTSDPEGPSQPREFDVILRGHSVRVRTDRGVFSADRLDSGTAVLLDAVPAPPTTGTFLDLGCGWGPISLALALASPAARVIGVDINERALGLTAANAAALGVQVRTVTPDQLLAEEPDLRLDVLWSNPAIRIGKPALHQMLRTWLPRLRPGGAAYLVVSKNLGADSLQRWIETELGQRTDRHGSSRGFRVLHVHGPAA